jgi:hypothetical protein
MKTKRKMTQSPVALARTALRIGKVGLPAFCSTQLYYVFNRAKFCQFIDKPSWVASHKVFPWENRIEGRLLYKLRQFQWLLHEPLLLLFDHAIQPSIEKERAIGLLLSDISEYDNMDHS